ncbi:Delta-1-pyrroline-5-carboxylate synthase [Blattella germanica]|nr:Delta-1-pyrroline-5-carboxylate synthase [Blattella germanica]
MASTTRQGLMVMRGQVHIPCGLPVGICRRAGILSLTGIRNESTWNLLHPHHREALQVDQKRSITSERRKAMFTDRKQLKFARRLVVKMGSAVITREDEHGLALGRLASIVEQDAGKLLDARAAAAIGQSGLMSLYEAMFAQYGVKIAQNRMGAIVLKDNDSLAAMLAAEVQADLLILMSDVDGIYTKPPTHEGARMLSTFTPDMKDLIKFGTKSRVGTGGMDSKVKSATWALDHGVSVVICNGMQDNAVKTILAGRRIGTFFTDAGNAAGSASTDVLAENARAGSRILQSLAPEERANCINTLADLLISKQEDILDANNKDLAEATKSGLNKPLLSRLSLTPAKLKNLATGDFPCSTFCHTNVNRVLRRTRLAPGLDLTQITVPIGVLLVIFESRPDCLPQVAALALSSANGLLLKGGKEAAHSNKALMDLVTQALETVGATNAISLVSTREEISDLLSMESHIDLIIPRGSTELVRSIQDQSHHIPVMGHAEGVCHVYVDYEADLKKAFKIIRDSKCDYPAACNAMETLLLHEDLVKDGAAFFSDVCTMLKNEGVTIYSGPSLSKQLTFGPPPAKTLKKEYSALECTIEVVKGIQEAVDHIHSFGNQKAKYFQTQVDSACVFHNASSRFADGYRFGLGAEVGISTSRIHARGPVGVEGLLTTKWVLRGEGHAASDFAEGGPMQFTHESLPIN